MNAVDLTPTFALRKLAVLFDGGKVAECAALVRRLSAITLESILGQLPVDILHDSLPSSLPVLEAIYVKVAQNSPGQLPTDKLRTDQLIQRLVALFAKHPPFQRPPPLGQALSGPAALPHHPHHPHPHHASSQSGPSVVAWGEEKNCNLHVPCCRSILRVVMDAEPNFRRTVAQRKRTLDKCLQRMGKHGLVVVDGGKPLVSLHEALRAEFDRQVAQYRGALQKLEQLGLVPSGKHGGGNHHHHHHHGAERAVSLTARPAPTEASHQRLLQVSRLDVQERVIKNKTVLNTVEPAANSPSLRRLLRTLRARVESDKLLLFHHTELRKMAAAASANAFSSSSSSSSLARLAVVAESSSSSTSGAAETKGSSSETQQMATTLRQFSQGYAALLRLAREVAEAQGEDVDDEDDEDAPLSDDSSEEEDERGGGGGEGGGGLGRGGRGGGGQGDGVEGGDYLSVTSALSILKKMKVVNLNGILPLQTATVTAASSSGRGRIRNGWRDASSAQQQQQQQQQHATLQGSWGQRKREAGLQTTPTMEHGADAPGELPHHCHHPTTTTTTALRKAPQGEESSNLKPPHTPPHPLSGSAAEETLQGDAPTNGPTAPSRSSPGAVAATSAAMLEQEVLYLRQELSSAREQIRTLQAHEKQLRDRLAGQAQQRFQMGTGISSNSSGSSRHGAQAPQFEDLSLGAQRPTELIRRYGDLYLDSRVEALDALDRLGPLDGLDVLKLKILFSVVVLSFKAAQQSVGELRGRLRHLLGLPVPRSQEDPPPLHPQPPYAHDRNHGGASERYSAAPSSSSSSSSSPSAAAEHMEYHITDYLCKTVDSFEVAEIVFEVCQQIYATLYDYPCLKACPGLLQYVTHCVRVAWGLSVQRCPYAISYEAASFQEGLHARFHTSDPSSTEVRSYLWPALLDSQGACVSRAVVIT
ncbi:uncharacterized protein LOC143279514 isoform X2 [Babylonia areolata]